MAAADPDDPAPADPPADPGEPADGEAEGSGGPPGRPPPPSLWKVGGIGFVVVLFVLLLPALWSALREITGSAALAWLGLLPPAAAVAILYLGLFD